MVEVNKTDLSKFIKESKTGKLSSSRLLVLAWGLGQGHFILKFDHDFTSFQA